ncbi:methyltransferase [Streptomyces sp. NPDC015350]|uniref:methyltransferase n=1 Tax=Streptomyces sp. NPDC015350 TaxID=3364955 RepID=UPI0036F94EC0
MDGETGGTRPFPQPFLVTLPGVYPPQSDTRLLLAALERERVGPGTAVPDVGTGSGAPAVRAAQPGCEVAAVDVALRAVIAARLDAMLRRGGSRAWNAGSDGRAVVDRLCTAVPSMLRRGGGVLLLVHSGLCDADVTLDRLRRAGLNAAVSSRARIPFGPVLLSRLRWLRERRLIRTDGTNEELVVIRAERP